MSTEQYVCSLCEDAFRETSENVNESINHLLFSPPKPAPHPAPCSPFYKASHHSLPQLKQSASDGCHLCTLLWAAAPSKVHSLYDEILRTDSHAQWLPCYITVDRAIFKTHQNPKRLLVEYKYQMALVDPKNYMQPLKRHFRLLWNEEAEHLIEQANVASNTWSQESWSAFRTWLRICLSEHNQCSPRSLELRRRQLPRRLVEVSQANTVRLRTIENNTENIHTIEYLALSHCWGSGPRFKLTSNSAAMLHEGVQISALSKTFQDAILVTKKFWEEFGVRHLWIDSLCIIQDSIEDWRRESAIMGEIYQNAFCTLAATAAEDGNRGLFFDREPRRLSPCVIRVIPKSGEMRRFYFADHQTWAKNVSKGPLNGRSWVLQERLLSPRVLHFAADQLYWECSGLEASEIFPRGFPDGFGDRFKQLLPFSGLPKIDQQISASRGPYDIWDRIMKIYSSGKLSRRTDRLVALSGIAHKVQRLIIPHDTYLAGMWKYDLPFELLWDVEVPSVHSFSREYVAPSWSWASRIGTIPCEKETWVSATKLVDITNAMVLPIQNDQMGQVCGGYICLCGMLVRGNLCRTYQPGSPNPGIALKVAGQMVYNAICRLDDGFSSTVQLPHDIYCLPVLRGMRNLRPIYKGLLLVPSCRIREFKRYGTFTADSFNESFVCRSSSGSETDILGLNGRYEITIV